MRRWLSFSAILLLPVLLTNCRQETALVGELVLEPGYTGDVRGSHVELYERFDLSGTPVATTVSVVGQDERNSEFRLSGLSPGTYYLLAWQDRAQDGRISDQDLVGVGGGIYRPGYGGEPYEVLEGGVLEVRTVWMRTWRDPVRTLSGQRGVLLDTTEFRVVFNYDLELLAMAVHFPGMETMLDPDAPGPKVAGETYISGGWNRGGTEMPAGRHRVNLIGILDSDTFNINLTTDIP